MRPKQFWPTCSQVAFLVLAISILAPNTFAATPAMVITEPLPPDPQLDPVMLRTPVVLA